MADATRRVVAGSVEEIPPGERKIIVPFRGRAGIGVFNVGGAYYALRNLCPHKQGPLCVGRVSGRAMAAAPPSTYQADLRWEREGEIIRCPWHLYEFELATGRCLVDPRLRARPSRWRWRTARWSSTPTRRMCRRPPPDHKWSGSVYKAC